MKNMPRPPTPKTSRPRGRPDWARWRWPSTSDVGWVDGVGEVVAAVDDEPSALGCRARAPAARTMVGFAQAAVQGDQHGHRKQTAYEQRG